jgi:hypothetical protein
MIGELEMHLWHVDLRHMASYASSGCDRARFFGSNDGPRVRRTGGVTREALRVVERVVVSERIVRIVTGYTAHPGVIQIMAFAIENSIRLKPHIDQARLAGHLHHLIEASMACSTEFLGQLIRSQDARIKDLRISCSAGFYSGYMLLTGAVTSLATHPRHEAVQRQAGLTVAYPAVAGKAIPCLVGTDRAAQSLFKAGRRPV